MMKWDDSYAIGIDVIDEQHKKLFEIAEEAEDLLELPNHLDKYDDIYNIVEELKDYVVYHFNEEEKLLGEIKYSKLFSHKVHHTDFIDEMNKIDMNNIDKDQTEGLREIVYLVTEWLVGHVLREDTVWAKEYKAKTAQN